MASVRTAVFPVAGRGTRFLPVTKASPKEMLPIVDKPLIQYAVEEAVAAGATKLVFVTGASKRAIEDHFDTDAELERQLAESGKHDMLALVRDIVPPSATCIFVRQGTPLGLGHAVLCAKGAVGDEPFFVHLADDLIYGDVGCLKQMRKHFEKHGASVLAVETVPTDQTGSYGIVAVQQEPGGAQRVTRIVEKPDVTPNGPHDLVGMNLWRFDRRIFDACREVPCSPRGEYELPLAVGLALARGMRVRVVPARGPVFDLSRRADAAELSRRLAGVTPQP